MNFHHTFFPILLFCLASVLCAADRVDRPIPPDMLKEFTEDMLTGKELSYGLYGRQPITWIGNATGDEMLRRAMAGELPDDDAFKHVSFVYGSYWDICRRYYMAYRVTGDERFSEQLRQYARLMVWILKDRPWLTLPQEHRKPRPVAAIPHEPGAASIFIGYALSARLTLQAARADRSAVTDVQLTEARRFLETTVRYMASQVTGDGSIDEKSGLPAVAARIVLTRPYNQSFMYYAVLGVAAVGLEDLQKLEGHEKHQKTIDLYRKIAWADRDAQSKIYTFAVDDAVLLFLNGREAKLADLKAGDRVGVRYRTFQEGKEKLCPEQIRAYRY